MKFKKGWEFLKKEKLKEKDYVKVKFYYGNKWRLIKKPSRSRTGGKGVKNRNS